MIDIDEEVYAFLKAHLVPFVDTTPNDVLRRIFFGGAVDPASPVPSAPPVPSGGPPSTGRKAGALMGLVEKGLIKPGHLLIFEQVQRARTHRAYVTDDGWVRLEGPNGGDYETPSAPLKIRLGYEINGWTSWVHNASKQTLDELRTAAKKL